MKKVHLIFSIICVIAISTTTLNSCKGKQKKTESKEVVVSDEKVEVGDTKVSTGKKWPAGMPSSIPQCKKGTIESVQDVSAGGMKTINMVISGLEASQIKQYAGAIADTDFKKTSMVENGEDIIATFSRGSDNISMNYTGSNKKLSMQYVGK